MQNNIQALELIEELSEKIALYIETLQSDVEPDEVDTREPHDDDYQPSMHNEHPGGGARFPALDRRWMAIGVTDLQKGLLALRRAATGGGF